MKEKKDLQNSKLNNWISDYFDDLSPVNCQIQKLTGRELIKFYQRNYYDDDKECFIMEKGLNNYVPLGMNTLSILPNEDVSYLIMTCKNKLGLQTIIASMEYIEKFHMRDDNKKNIDINQAVLSIDFNKYVNDMELINIFLAATVDLNEEIINKSNSK